MAESFLIKYKESILLVAGLVLIAEQTIAQLFGYEPNALIIGGALGMLSLSGAFLGDKAIKRNGNGT